MSTKVEPRDITFAVQLVADRLGEELAARDTEIILALLLDTNQRVIEQVNLTLESSEIQSKGDFTRAFERAAELQAAGILIVHNHPTKLMEDSMYGSPLPSENDLLSTQALLLNSAMRGINLIDHVIVGTDGLTHSMRYGTFGWPHKAQAAQERKAA